mmetsp:Transcript_34654/g.42750  ORF Transcript_34654/g.42750 Transcript_34654/m.42750 type:complete len:87 (+) Transcript_34654:340-600(+)
MATKIKNSNQGKENDASGRNSSLDGDREAHNSKGLEELLHHIREMNEGFRLLVSQHNQLLEHHQDTIEPFATGLNNTLKGLARRSE